MNNNGYTYRIGKACIRALESAGWVHIATVLSDQGDKAANGHYGMLFTKECASCTREFWLNKDTYKSLPLLKQPYLG